MAQSSVGSAGGGRVKILVMKIATSAQYHNFTQTKNIPIYIFIANKGLLFYSNVSKTALANP